MEPAALRSFKHRSVEASPIPLRVGTHGLQGTGTSNQSGETQQPAAQWHDGLGFAPVSRRPAITIGNRNAALHGVRLRGGETVQLPDARYLHVFTARGEVTLEGGGDLGAGDAARISGGGGQRLTTNGLAEILIWQMHAQVA